MATVKAIPLRLDPELYRQLALRAQAEGRSMNDVVREALRTHFEARPIPRERLREMVAQIAAEGAELLEALRKV